MRYVHAWVLLLSLSLAGVAPASVSSLALEGEFRQGGLVRGQVPPGSRVLSDGRPVRVSPNGLFLIGFHRDEAAESVLEVTYPDGRSETRRLAVAPREYLIQRIDGA